MKNKIKSIYNKLGAVKYFVTISSILVTNFLYAPPAPPTTTTGTVVTGQPCFGPQCVPIDTGLIFLIIAGVLLGLRFVYVLRQRQQA